MTGPATPAGDRGTSATSTTAGQGGTFRYVIGYNGDKRSKDALRLGIALAKAFNAELEIVCILRSDEPYLPVYPPVGDVTPMLRRQANNWLHEALDTVPDDVVARGHVRTSLSVAAGLLVAVVEFEATLVVVGAASGKYTAKFSVGPVTDALLHRAGVPVALAPRGYKGVTAIKRLYAGIGMRPGAHRIMREAREAAYRSGLELDLVSFLPLDHVQGEATEAEDGTDKGLSSGSVGLLGAVVIGMSCIAPAYTLSGALGPTAAAVDTHLPAIFLVGFIPMLLVAVGYRQLNRAMPDSGTTFTWTSKAFGPWVGWMGGWGLLAATILVLSNLAGIAVEFFYLMIAQVTGRPEVADLASNVPVNILTCLVFMAGACWISYRGVETTEKVQWVLVAFQIIILLWFSVAAFVHVANGTAEGGMHIQAEWFNPLGVGSLSAFAAGVSLSVFIYWGWDVVLTINEETKGAATTPGRAALATIFSIVVLYMVVGLAVLSFAGLGDTGVGLNNPEIQENVFAALAGPVMGPAALLLSLAVLSSSAASLQSTFVSPARTMLAMG